MSIASIRGITPRSVSLTPGSHQVTITKTGYQIYYFTANILSNKVTSLYAVLVPLNQTNQTNQTTNGTNATFDFSVSVLPTSVALNHSAANSTNNATAVVKVNLLQGTTQLVSLSSTGCPTGTTCSFSPTQGNPTFNSVFSVLISSSTSAGTYPITITGTGGGKTRTAYYTLNVTG